MPVLSNPRHERFAQEMAKSPHTGLNAGECYIKAGYDATEDMARRAGSRLANKEHVAARIAEIIGRAAERAEVTIASVMTELAKIGFANMGDYMKVGPDGDPVLDFGSLTRDQMAALAEVTVEDFKDGRGKEARDVRKVKFKLADKRAALVDLGRHLGAFVDRQEIGGPGDFARLTETELEQQLSERAQRLGIKPPNETAH